MFLKIKRAQFNPQRDIVLEDIVINTDYVLMYERGSTHVDRYNIEHQLTKMVLVGVQEQPQNIEQLPSQLDPYFNIIGTATTFNPLADPCSLSGGAGFVTPVIAYPYIRLKTIQNNNSMTTRDIVLNSSQIVWFENHLYMDAITRQEVQNTTQIIVKGDPIKRIVCNIPFNDLANYFSTTTV